MATISIYSKKVFNFTNQSSRNNPEDLLKVAAGDKGALSTANHFTTTPYQVEKAPDWIKADDLFKWALKDGDIMELAVATPQAAIEKEAELLQSKEDKDAGKPVNAEEEEKKETLAEAKLNRMNKQELVVHAKETHDLELDPADTKPVLIDKILKAQGGEN